MLDERILVCSTSNQRQSRLRAEISCLELSRTGWNNIQDRCEYNSFRNHQSSYCKRIPKPLPPRNAEDILKYIADNCLTFKYLFSEEDEYGYERCKAIELYQDNEPISMTNYSENCIREAVEPIMDMDEL